MDLFKVCIAYKRVGKQIGDGHWTDGAQNGYDGGCKRGATSSEATSQAILALVRKRCSDYDPKQRKRSVNRQILSQLKNLLEINGVAYFYPNEWWHFDHVDWQHYPIENISFEELQKL